MRPRTRPAIVGPPEIAIDQSHWGLSNTPILKERQAAGTEDHCSSALDQTELVFQRVGQNRGSIPAFVVVFLQDSRAEANQSGNFGVEVIDENIEVSPVLASFRLRHTLQREVMQTPVRRHERMELRIVCAGGGFVVSKSGFPEEGRSLHVDAIERHSHSAIHNDSFLERWSTS